MKTPIVPKQVIIREKWPGLGTLVDVRVPIKGEWYYTTLIVKKTDNLVARIKATRKLFQRGSHE